MMLILTELQATRRGRGGGGGEGTNRKKEGIEFLIRGIAEQEEKKLESNRFDLVWIPSISTKMATAIDSNDPTITTINYDDPIEEDAKPSILQDEEEDENSAEIASMRARVLLMEAEAAKLRLMTAESISASGTTSDAMITDDEKEATDSRSVYVGNVRFHLLVFLFQRAVSSVRLVCDDIVVEARHARKKPSRSSKHKLTRNEFTIPIRSITLPRPKRFNLISAVAVPSIVSLFSSINSPDQKGTAVVLVRFETQGN